MTNFYNFYKIKYKYLGKIYSKNINKKTMTKLMIKMI